MAGLTYLLLNGKRQGLILKSCLTQNSVGHKALAAHLHIPHNIHHTGEEPQESVSFSYQSISWEHCIAGTSAYSIWEDRVF
jgi:type VI protein secretion system component Hcp